MCFIEPAKCLKQQNCTSMFKKVACEWPFDPLQSRLISAIGHDKKTEFWWIVSRIWRFNIGVDSSRYTRVTVDCLAKVRNTDALPLTTCRQESYHKRPIRTVLNQLALKFWAIFCAACRMGKSSAKKDFSTSSNTTSVLLHAKFIVIYMILAGSLHLLPCWWHACNMSSDKPAAASWVM